MTYCECPQTLEVNQPPHLPSKSVKLCLCDFTLLSIFDEFDSKWAGNSHLLENIEQEVLVDRFLF